MFYEPSSAKIGLLAFVAFVCVSSAEYRARCLSFYCTFLACFLRNCSWVIEHVPVPNLVNERAI